jgi:hypothetical protein
MDFLYVIIQYSAEKRYKQPFECRRTDQNQRPSNPAPIWIGITSPASCKIDPALLSFPTGL